MKRYFFVEENLDRLERIERELEAQGIAPPQIHVLSDDDAGVSAHHLREVHSILRKDIIHSSKIGALIGAAVSVLMLGLAYIGNLPQTIGWAPLIFLVLILLGFFTWEGGLFGIQTPNSQFRVFEGTLQSGRHVFFVDVANDQEKVLLQLLVSHPELKAVGTGSAPPQWVISWQQKWQNFLSWAP